MLSDTDRNFQGSMHLCDNCGKEFEYGLMSGNEIHDYDFDGNLIQWIEMNCPHCGEPNKLYGL